MVELRGWVTFQGIKTARTLLSQPYPPRLAVAYGDLMAEALQLRVMARSEGRPPPMAEPSLSFGHALFGFTWDRERVVS